MQTSRGLLTAWIIKPHTRLFSFFSPSVFPLFLSGRFVYWFRPLPPLSSLAFVSLRIFPQLMNLLDLTGSHKGGGLWVIWMRSSALNAVTFNLAAAGSRRGLWSHLHMQTGETRLKPTARHVCGNVFAFEYAGLKNSSQGLEFNAQTRESEI